MKSIRYGLAALIAAAPVAADAATYRNAPTLALVLAGVGQKVDVGGVRNSKCGAAAPTWTAARKTLTLPTRGSVSDGGVGWRFSGRCNAWVKVRVVRYTAKRTGQDKLVVDGDTVNVTIRP